MVPHLSCSPSPVTNSNNMTAYMTCENNVPSHACENTHVISEIHPYNFQFLLCMGAKGSGRKGSDKKDVLWRNGKQSCSLLCSRLLFRCLLEYSLVNLREWMTLIIICVLLRWHGHQDRPISLQWQEQAALLVLPPLQGSHLMILDVDCTYVLHSFIQTLMVQILMIFSSV